MPSLFLFKWSCSSSFVSATINKSSNRPKALFNTINKLTKPPPQDTLASYEFCCSFLNYLIEKTDASTSASLMMLQSLAICQIYLVSGQSVLFFSVSELILKSNSLSCGLDPAPISLLKLCHSFISAPISHFINASLTSASFPLPLKTAAVTPVLKKPNLDPSVLTTVLF